MSKMIKKADIIFISSVVTVIVTMSIFCFFAVQRDADKVIIEVGGQVFATESLNDNKEIKIDKLGVNIVKIQNGKVSMSFADCKDQICVHQGEIENAIQTIVCLPNQVIVSLETDNQSDIDVVS